MTRRDPLKVAPASVDDDGMVEDAVLGLDGDASTLAPGEDPDRLMSVAQVARRLDCSVSLVQKWRRFGWLPAQQLGPPDVPIYGYRLGDVEQFAAEKWNRKRGRPAGSTTKTEDGSAPRRPVRVARPVPDGLDQPAATVGPVIGGQDAGSQLPRAPRARKPKPVPPVQLGPTTIWAGDPRQRGALMLVRLPAGPLANVLQLVEQYSQRYDDVALSAAQSAGPTASQAPVLARWIRGVRVEE
ncbi:MAG: hypothetical protein EBS94_14645 [Proteobacteria bacterium]|nr:hypothetical protein [Pseudomonadota bacterium]